MCSCKEECVLSAIQSKETISRRDKDSSSSPRLVLLIHNNEKKLAYDGFLFCYLRARIDAKKVRVDSIIWSSCSWSRYDLDFVLGTGDRESQSKIWNLKITKLNYIFLLLSREDCYFSMIICKNSFGGSWVARTCKRKRSASTMDLQKWHCMYVIAWPFICRPFRTHNPHIIS